MMKRFATACLVLTAFMRLGAQNVNFTSSNLPVIVINTNGQTIVDDPKIVADMGIVFNSGGARNSLTDPFNHYTGKIGIEIRGQSSQMFPMKSYGIELRDDAGNSIEKSLFGLPKEADWVLYAPYTDKTLMRNFLAYTMSRELGHWSANCRFVEVVINGDYKGIYVFMERIKRGSGRVNIAKMGSTDISGDALTGGYIFSLDKEPNGWFSAYKPPNSSNNTTRQFSYVYPKVENIVPAQKEYIKTYVDSFEKSLAAGNFQDKDNGVRKFADLPSFIDYFIVNEVSRNVDGYRLSAFFYKDRDSRNRKIFAGPVWDYDLAFRNADYCEGSSTNGWAYRFNNVCPGDGAGLVPFWWERLMKDTAYVSALRCRWKEVSTSSISLNRLNFLIDSVVNLLAESQQRHFQRWAVLGKYVWPNPQPIPTSYAGEIDALKSWLSARLQWIDNNIPNKGDCFDYPSSVKESYQVSSLTPNPSNISTTLTIQSRINQVLDCAVFDAHGKKVHYRAFSVQAGINTISLPSNRWQAGIYFVSFVSPAGEKVLRKLVKN